MLEFWRIKVIFKIKQGTKRKRYIETDDDYEAEPVQVVGLSMRNVTGEILNKPLRLMSKFITTQCGVEYESNSRSVYYQLALYGDMKDPISFVSL